MRGILTSYKNRTLLTLLRFAIKMTSTCRGESVTRPICVEFHPTPRQLFKCLLDCKSELALRHRQAECRCLRAAPYFFHQPHLRFSQSLDDDGLRTVKF